MLTVSRAGFDWRGFGRALRQALKARGQPALRGLADRIGVTATDLSRAASGANVGIEKVFAIADWMGEDARNFYAPPENSTCCTSCHVKPDGQAEERV